MTRVLAAVGALVLGSLGAVAVPGAAVAAPAGMVLRCDGGLTISRSNGASWWDVDSGATYTTTHLRITSLDGELQYEKSYGSGRPRDTEVCVAQHGPFPDGYPGSIWTVHLVRAA